MELVSTLIRSGRLSSLAEFLCDEGKYLEEEGVAADAKEGVAEEGVAEEEVNEEVRSPLSNEGLENEKCR